MSKEHSVTHYIKVSGKLERDISSYSIGKLLLYCSEAADHYRILLSRAKSHQEQLKFECGVDSYRLAIKMIEHGYRKTAECIIVIFEGDINNSLYNLTKYNTKNNAEFNIDLIHKIGQDDLVNSFTEEQQVLYDKQMFLHVSRWYCAKGREDKAKQLLNDFFNPQLL